MDLYGHSCRASDFHIQLDGDSTSPDKFPGHACFLNTRKRPRSCEERLVSIKNVTVDRRSVKDEKPAAPDTTAWQSIFRGGGE
jgi:hypothetical protein